MLRQIKVHVSILEGAQTTFWGISPYILIKWVFNYTSKNLILEGEMPKVMWTLWVSWCNLVPQLPRVINVVSFHTSLTIESKEASCNQAGFNLKG
jgi:hypothetical protein